MSQIYYSASKRGFFIEKQHELPDDVVAITDERHHELMFAQSIGHVIVPDANGKPIAVPFEPSAEDLKRHLVITARELLTASDIAVLQAYEAGKTVPEAIVTYRRELRDVLRGTRATLPTPPTE